GANLANPHASFAKGNLSRTSDCTHGPLVRSTAKEADDSIAGGGEVVVASVATAAVLLVLQLAVAGWGKCSLRRLLIRPGRSEVNDWIFFAIQAVGLTDYFVLVSSFGAAWAAGVFANRMVTAASSLRIHVQ